MLLLTLKTVNILLLISNQADGLEKIHIYHFHPLRFWLNPHRSSWNERAIWSLCILIRRLGSYLPFNFIIVWFIYRTFVKWIFRSCVIKHICLVCTWSCIKTLLWFMFRVCICIWLHICISMRNIIRIYRFFNRGIISLSSCRIIEYFINFYRFLFKCI